MELAKEKSPYSTFKGSPLSEGKFQFDLWGVKPSGKWDWEELKEKILKHGVRNSLTTACMPTASTGIILKGKEPRDPYASADLFLSASTMQTFSPCNDQ